MFKLLFQTYELKILFKLMICFFDLFLQEIETSDMVGFKFIDYFPLIENNFKKQ